MSLTKAEWVKMWNALKRLEPRFNLCTDETCTVCIETNKDLKIIKDKIQKVIGQME